MDILAEINRVMELESRALGRLRQTVGPAYEKAVLMIYACPGKVILTGMGKSGIIAQKIASTMVSTGTPATFLHPAEGAHGDIGIAHKDDVILAISKSGESDELIGLLLTVRDLMRTGTRNPVVKVNASVQEMFSEITAKHTGAVSIVDDAGKLVGLVTDYDIRRAVGEGRNIFKMTIREIMNPNPIRVNVDEKAIQALKIMEEREKPLAVLPVVDSDSIVRGMIHLHDLIDKGL